MQPDDKRQNTVGLLNHEIETPILSEPFFINCGIRQLRLSERTHVMGVLNVTPDSFYDGGRYFLRDRAVAKGLEMTKQGADIIDVGGESTRPGSLPVDINEEIKRVVPVIEQLHEQIDIPISIDTQKADVAEAAIRAGAAMINDISSLRFDRRMAWVAAEYCVPLILMHMKGTPQNMQNHPEYKNLILEIIEFLAERIRFAVQSGIDRRKLIIDPGIGFGKMWEDNFIILKHLSAFLGIGHPILIGVSRKFFIGRVLDLPEEERMIGTAAAVAVSIQHGVHIVRVHDVKEMVQVAHIADRIRHADEFSQNGL
jgi:dihydropteroate synthase